MGGAVKRKKKIGRPSKLPKINLALVKELARQGKTPPQIADELGIAASTVYEWVKKNKAFSESLTAGRRVADAKVERSLYERAIGYEHPEEKIFCNEGEIVRAKTTKRYPPDVMAMIFWLKNRKPNEWKDKQEVEHSGALDLTSGIHETRARVETEGGGE